MLPEIRCKLLLKEIKTPKSIQETIEIMAVAENGIFEEAKAQFATLEATIHNCSKYVHLHG